jgi:hypothetical protein
MTLLRQYINQHFVLAPKPLPEFSLRRRERSPLLDGLRGQAWAKPFFCSQCGAAFVTGIVIAAASLFG